MNGAAAAALAAFNATGRGYLIEQSTRSQTLGYALLDSPVALAAWMLDHHTDRLTRPSCTSNEPARGGHFAAWEEPQLFSSEVRAAFRSLR